jgi:hypothetical protein
VQTRDNAIIRRLMKTRTETTPDYAAERIQYEKERTRFQLEQQKEKATMLQTLCLSPLLTYVFRRKERKWTS